MGEEGRAGRPAGGGSSGARPCAPRPRPGAAGSRVGCGRRRDSRSPRPRGAASLPRGRAALAAGGRLTGCEKPREGPTGGSSLEPLSAPRVGLSKVSFCSYTRFLTGRKPQGNVNKEAR